ncbi:hypothetical protein HOD38_00160 [archaeon]|jgi:hypothetical protein|nr:hypothetical protein [archaeon]MBT4396659.1 hypothetical protein [archaeon]MBT4441269.1 hypothetical protein [archaeon]
MVKECILCNSEDKYHAKGLCKPCYDKKRAKKPEIKVRRKKQRQTEEFKQKRRKYRQREEVKEKARKYHQRPEVRERMNEHQRNYRANPNNQEKIRAYNQRPETKARNKIYQRFYQSTDEYKAKRKSYREQPEIKARRDKYIKRYRLKPKVIQRIKEYNKSKEVKERAKIYEKQPRVIRLREAYRKSEKGRMVDIKSHSKRRLRLRGHISPSGISVKVQKLIKERDKNCVYCGSNEKLGIDHIVAVAKGGTNTYNNLVLACNKCNMFKKTKNVYEWCEEVDIPVPPIVEELLNKEREQKKLII